MLTAVLNAGTATAGHPAATAEAATVAPIEEVAYYGNWDIYGNQYYLKNVATSGAAAKLTTLIYGFENIDPVSLACFQTVKSADPSETNPNAGDGAGDAWADYQKPFDQATSVSGTADTWNQPLRGNFNQLRELKAKYPKLKILVSLGGWTFSKYFSAAAATPSSRAKLVQSCLDMYIRGTLPKNIAGDTTAGGSSVAANIFDGVDIDWESPASDGHVGNIQSPADTTNYTALLAEFRSQLDVAGAASGKHYLLTAAVPSGPKNIKLLQVRQISPLLDFANIMSYDMHGSWEPTGPANFQAPLYSSPADLSVDKSVTYWRTAGMPAKKLVVGVPAYWRGWTGVAAGAANGLYQTANGPSAALARTQSLGVANYDELLRANKLSSYSYDSVTHSPWAFDGTNFWTGDIPATAQEKGLYAATRGLRGAMLFALDGDAAGAPMVEAISAGLHGSMADVAPVRFSSNAGLAGVSSTFTSRCPLGPGTVTVVDAATGTTSPVQLGLSVSKNGVDHTQAVTWRSPGSYLTKLQCGSVTSFSRPMTVGKVNYAAMGDSYSSGEGVPSFIPPSDKDGCHRSHVAYSDQQVAQPDWTDGFRFVACSGAEVANFYRGQNGEPPQVSSLSAATTLVSLTAGGNNVGFASTLEFCVVVLACTSGTDWTTRSAIKKTLPQLKDLYLAILKGAPNAQVYVLGYPRFFSDTPGFVCNGIEAGEAVWMNAMVDLLDSGIRQQVATIGDKRLHFVDTASAFAGGELCAGSATSYMNGIVAGHVEYSFHPTADGQAMLSRRFWRAVLPYS